MTHVTVSIPYWRCEQQLRRAVLGVLNQTYRHLRLVVTNDGDTPPWHVLSDITDDRLVRHDLPDNHGRYFVDAVVLAATDSPWWVVHDADDQAEPTWLETMMDLARDTGAVAVFGRQTVHRLNGTRYVEEVPLLDAPLTSWMRHLAHHAGLYRTDVLKSVGGYHPGFRVGYDTLVVNLMRLAGPVRSIHPPLYHRHLRRGSLTLSPATGMRSGHRAAAVRRLGVLYRAALDGDVTTAVRNTVPPKLEHTVTHHAGLLRKVLDA